MTLIFEWHLGDVSSICEWYLANVAVICEWYSGCDVWQLFMNDIQGMWQLFLTDIQGVKSETLSLFGVRVTTDGRGLILPVYSFTGALVGVKIISAAQETDSVKTHITTRTIPRFSNSLLIQWCTVQNISTSYCNGLGETLSNSLETTLRAGATHLTRQQTSHIEFIF